MEDMAVYVFVAILLAMFWIILCLADGGGPV